MRIIKGGRSRDKETAEILAAELRKGGVAVVPTDTVYGLICDGNNPEAKEKIFRLKKRPAEKSLIGFVKDRAGAEKFAYVQEKFIPLIEERWPGGHTFIFKAKVFIKHLVRKNGTIGLRVPDVEFLNLLSEKMEIVASTSANLSGAGNPAEFEDVPEPLKEQADVCVDGGMLRGKPSLLWDLTGKKPLLIKRER